MSETGDDGEEIPGREIAYRILAAEYDDASVSHTESDEERAPNYVITPTGARVNRLFAVGTLTEVTSVNDEMVRARVVDPTGAFVVYAGKYQPDALAFLEGTNPPAFVAVTGKARTFQPDDSNQVYTSIRPESIATVDADTRDRWVLTATERTLERIGTYAEATGLDVTGDELTAALLEAGVEQGLASGVPLAREHYDTTPSYLGAVRDCALEAVEVVAGDRDEVSGIGTAPSDAGDSSVTFDALSTLGDVDSLEEASVAVASEGATSAPSSADDASGAGSDDESETTDETAVPDETAVTDEASDTVSMDEEDDAPSIDEGADTPSVDETDGLSSPAETVDAGEDLRDGNDGATDELGDFDAADAGDGMYEMDDDEREQLEAEFGTEFTTGGEVDEPGQAGIDVPSSEDGSAEDEPTEDEPTEDESAAPESDDLGAPPTSRLEEPSAESEDKTADEPDEAESAGDSGKAETASDEPETGRDDDSDDGVERESASEPADEADPDEDLDVQKYVIDTMSELDDGDGADRTELIETATTETGLTADEVEDAIQDALMGGQCYEPNDETVKPI
ncbi:hypothetical protein EA462_03590 [Natrarchaeobius halalkaliphilus]|uniref:Rpa-associated protein n=1 Tax=Natrarchaeobius halalkaliphilus TaxID=1679091 RepID=A0A3N6LU75_9EURY|nr:hypothetical protein [Natrarchaeobius halalkaliphilus]RQG91094.1 hypothetical protein EA462_03590 [Natrarchaeobius halalkaliphilus]